MTHPTKKLGEISKLIQGTLEEISDSRSQVWHTSEWNICHHIAGRLENCFSDFDVDIELVKNNGQRPDIVVHKSGHNKENLIAIEVKKDPTKKDVESDIKKIEELFFAEPYNYSYGIFISIGKLPKELPDFDKSRINIHQVYGWKLITEEEFRSKKFDL